MQSDQSLRRYPSLCRPAIVRLMIGAALVLLLGAGCTQLRLGARGGKLPPVKVGAYYRLTAPEEFEEGYLREKLVPPQSPLLGEYSCWDVRTAEKHIEWASRYGVDFFVLEYGAKATTDLRFDLFMEARNIGDVEFCLFLQPGLASALGAELRAAAERFFSHPSYLKHQGRPVVVLGLNESLTDEAIEKARTTLREQGIDLYLVADGLDWMRGEPFPEGRLPVGSRLTSHLFDAVSGYRLFDRCPRSHRGYGLTRNLIEDLTSSTREFSQQNPGTPVLPAVLVGFNDRGVTPNSNRTVVPRSWRTSGEASTLAHELTGYAFHEVEFGAPFILVRSWNEWSNDCALEPLKEASPTRQDRSGKGQFSDGFSYFGNGLRALEEFRDVVAPVAGTVVTPVGSGAPDVPVYAWKGRDIVAETHSNSLGEFRFLRMSLPAGVYRIGLHYSESTEVRVSPFSTHLGSTFTVDEEPKSEKWELELEPWLKSLGKESEDYLAAFPKEKFRVERAGTVTYYAKGDSEQSSALPMTELEPGIVALEVGAGQGLGSLKLSASLADATIYASEHRPEQYRLLVENLKLNETRSIIALHTLLADRPGVLNPQSALPVEQRTVDSLRFPRLDCILVHRDIDWRSLLEGARETLHRRNPLVWLEGTVTAKQRGELENWLAMNGYSLEDSKAGLWGRPLRGRQDRDWVDIGRPEQKLEGFFRPERDGKTSFTWLEKHGRFQVEIGHPNKSSPYILGLRARAFEPLEPLEIEVQLNGGPSLTTKLKADWSLVKLEVPAGQIREGNNEVVISSRSAMRPTEHGSGNEDDRRISVAVDAAWLVPASKN